MELGTAAVAIGTVLATKALEKTGENVGGLIWDKTSHFVNALQKSSPDTVTAIANLADLSDGQMIVDVREKVSSEANKNPDLKQAMDDLANHVKSEELPNLTAILQEIKEALSQQSSSVENYGKMAEEIKVEKGSINAQKVNIENQTNTYY